MPKKATTKAKRKTVPHARVLAPADAQMFVFRLCISGMTPRSREALINLKRVCDTYLDGRYQLEVIDLYQQPELAAVHQIIATPTLLKSYPLPLRRLIGDLSNITDTALRLIGIEPPKTAKTSLTG